MSCNEFEMWKNNIENATSRVVAEYGSYAVNSVYARYDAHAFYDLASCYFSDVFADLEMMANDN